MLNGLHAQCQCVWGWGVKLVVRRYELWHLPGWEGHVKEDSGSWMPKSVSCHVTSFLPFIGIWDQLHFAAQLHVAKVRLYCCCSFGNSFEPAHSTNSEPIDISLPAQEGNLPVALAAKGPGLTRHEWKMLIAMEGPKLRDTENSAVKCYLSQCQTGAEFCIRTRSSARYMQDCFVFKSLSVSQCQCV